MGFVVLVALLVIEPVVHLIAGISVGAGLGRVLGIRFSNCLHMWPWFAL